MTRLDAIKAALRGLDPNGFVKDMAWLLAQVEALAGAAKALHDASLARLGHGHTHPTDYDFLPEHCARCRAEREIAIALTAVQEALAALEAPNA